MPQDRPTIEQVKDRYTSNLMSIEGVVGVAIGLEQDQPVIKVYVSAADGDLQTRVPRELEGYPVSIESTGEIRALQ
jgi:hypothetical protein